MKDPAVLFYTKDFLSGTAFFTDAERGQYIRLLCEQHQNGHIPENHMVSVCLSLASPVVKKFVKDEAGNYFNERMEEEINKRSKFIESRVYNGSKGGRPKQKEKPSGKPLGLATENLIANANVNEDVIENKKGVKGEKQIPEYDEFKKYALENAPNVNLVSLDLKYKGWKENGWKDGYNQKILNWKSKLLHTLPHLLNSQQQTNKVPSNSVNSLWENRR